MYFPVSPSSYVRESVYYPSVSYNVHCTVNETLSKSYWSKFMRLLIESYLGCRILQDKSPAGVPRWIVETPDSVRVYSKTWYSLSVIRGHIENEYL